MTEDILNSYESIIVSVKCEESLANCLVITAKFLFYDSLQNSDPIFNDRRLLVSILSQLLDYHPSISISLALSIILDKVQLREKCFFEKIKVHSLCWHAGSFAFNANRVGVEKVIHSEAHINVLNRNVVWQIEKHF